MIAANLVGQGSMNGDLSGGSRFQVGGGVSANLKGQIDEVRISDIARAATDMIGGLPPDPPAGTVISIR